MDSSSASPSPSPPPSSSSYFRWFCDGNKSRGASPGYHQPTVRQAKSSPSPSNYRHHRHTNQQQQQQLQQQQQQQQHDCQTSSGHGETTQNPSRPPSAHHDQTTASSGQKAINFWHYKQTGIRSRPIKLLTHPIEHIERKIIITYLLGILFKFMAISTGPIIVLIFYLITLPFTLSRRLIWFLLNLSFLCDARIRTTKAMEKPTGTAAATESASIGRTNSHVSSACELASSTSRGQTNDYYYNNCTSIGSKDHHQNSGGGKSNALVVDKQTQWRYCPLDFIESYWFKEKLVNNVILVIEDDKRKFSIDKLREHLRNNVLNRPEYRKFLSRVVARGIPFYKSHYWHYLGLLDADGCGEQTLAKTKQNHQITADASNQQSDDDDDEHDSNSSSRFSDQFSVTSTSECSNLEHINPNPSVFIDLSTNLQQDQQQQQSKENNNNNNNRLAKSESNGVNLQHHVYVDNNLETIQPDGSQIHMGIIRRYACKLLNLGLDMERPLWELRAIPSSFKAPPEASRKIYLIFRCHQSLADGKSLSKMLTEHLTVPPPSPLISDGGYGGCAVAPQIRLHDDSNTDATIAAQVGSARSSGDDEQDDESGQHQQQSDNFVHQRHDSEVADCELKPLREKESFVARVSEGNSRLSAIFVGPLTVLLWIIWSFTRRKNNHLNKCLSDPELDLAGEKKGDNKGQVVSRSDPRRFYMTQYDLTKFHQIKQMTRSTVSDVILCALSGALRDYLRKFNAVSNPPDLNISLTVDMRQEKSKHKRRGQKLDARGAEYNHHHHQSSISSRSSDSSCNSSASPVGMAAHHHYHGGGGGSNCKSSPLSPIAPPHPEVNYTLVNVPIPTSVEGTIPRLWDIRGTMEELRTSADPWVMLGLKRLLFEVLPSSWYRSIVNYIALGNSSMFVSNIQGPQNMVESWCVDLFQRALLEARQSPKIYMVSPDGDLLSTEDQSNLNEHHASAAGAAAAAADNPSSPTTGELMKTADNCLSSSSTSHLLQAKQHQREELARRRHRKIAAAASRLELIEGMGSIAALYYCMQPPTSNIPISFNCITYHSKLFVTSLSRSLLVEDSKLLIRLFFRQLDQLADTIARRRSLVTIIQRPAVPIEVQPSSPTELSSLDDGSFEMSQQQQQRQDSERDYGEAEEDDDEETTSFASRIRSQLFAAPCHKDDIETDIGSSTVKCQSCLRKICICRRRKSLFAPDNGTKDRAANLMSLLRPVYSIRSKRSLSPQSASPNEMRSLDELREEDTTGVENEETLAVRESAAKNSRGKEPEFGKATTTSWKPSTSKRSTLSLDFSARDTAAHLLVDEVKAATAGAAVVNNNNKQPQRLRHSDQNFNKNLSQESGLHNSDQLIVPSHNQGRVVSSADATTASHEGRGVKQQQQLHSRSETDLLPSVCGLEPRDDRSDESIGRRRGSAASWLTFVRRQRLSRHSRSAAATAAAQPMDVTSSSRNSFANLDSTRSERRAIFEVGSLTNRRLDGTDPSYSTSATTMASMKRRRSAAAGATTRSSVVMMKDEMNADVSLRYHHQLERPLKNLRSRRFSAIVGPSSSSGQRRASLIPFGLIPNSSLAKMFSEDPEEAHV